VRERRNSWSFFFAFSVDAV